MGMPAVLVAVIFDFHLDEIISLHCFGSFACGRSFFGRLFLYGFIFLFSEQTHNFFLYALSMNTTLFVSS